MKRHFPNNNNGFSNGDFPAAARKRTKVGANKLETSNLGLLDAPAMPSQHLFSQPSQPGSRRTSTTSSANNSSNTGVNSSSSTSSLKQDAELRSSFDRFIDHFIAASAKYPSISVDKMILRKVQERTQAARRRVSQQTTPPQQQAQQQEFSPSFLSPTPLPMTPNAMNMMNNNNNNGMGNNNLPQALNAATFFSQQNNMMLGTNQQQQLQGLSSQQQQQQMFGSMDSNNSNSLFGGNMTMSFS